MVKPLQSPAQLWRWETKQRASQPASTCPQNGPGPRAPQNTAVLASVRMCVRACHVVNMHNEKRRQERFRKIDNHHAYK